MKISIHERFHKFLVRNHLSVALIQKIVTEYANSNAKLARSYFMQKFNISEHVFYKCRDFAIICCLVDNKTCNLLYNKTCENNRSHNPENSFQSSISHFNDLLSKRKEFINSFSNSDILDIARKYAEGMSKEKIALAYETGEYCISLILYRGITQLIIDRNLLDNILLIIPSSPDKVLAVRQQNKSRLLKIQKQDIEILKFKIENYSIYYRIHNISKEELNEQLKTAQEIYENTLKL